MKDPRLFGYQPPPPPFIFSLYHLVIFSYLPAYSTPVDSIGTLTVPFHSTLLCHTCHLLVPNSLSSRHTPQMIADYSFTTLLGNIPPSLPEVSLSPTNVHSTPQCDIHENITLKSTFSCNSQMSSLSNSECTSSLKSQESLKHKVSPALRAVLHSKNSSSYRLRKASSKLTLHSSGTTIMSFSESVSDQLPYLDAHCTILSSSSSVETAIEIDEYNHPLSSQAKLPDVGSSTNESCGALWNGAQERQNSSNVDKNSKIHSNSNNRSRSRNQNKKRNTNKKRTNHTSDLTKQLTHTTTTSIFETIKDKLKNSHLITTARSFYRCNESILKHTTPLIDLHHRDLVLYESTPLTTYSTILHPLHEERNTHLDTSWCHLPPTRQREHRINPLFLRFYAIISSLKIKYHLTLLNESTIDYYQQEFNSSNSPTLDEFFQVYFSEDSDLLNGNADFSHLKSLLKFSILSRDKMSSNVVLTPRGDPFQSVHTYNNSRKLYIKTGEIAIPHGTLVREGGTKVMPWVNLSDYKSSNRRSLNPCGTLPNNIQYTVKNWGSKRWSLYMDTN